MPGWTIMPGWNRALPAAAGVLLLVSVAAPAGAQDLARNRLRLLPAQVDFGGESTRLLGMGGFVTAVRDERIELGMWDFSRNPAGFGDDRDSWSLDLDYNHHEFAERDRRQLGNDIFINQGSLGGGFYKPGRFGLGAALDYAEIEGQDFASGKDQFEVVSVDVAGNKYVSDKLSLGVNLGYGTESQSGFHGTVYNINHDALTVRGGVGAAYTPVTGVVVGGRVQGIGTSVDGLSQGDFHEDAFDWSRPGALYGVQGFVTRGRLSLGVDATGRQFSGRESVRTSWSERFGFNPTDDFVVEEKDTISEDRSDFTLKARGLVAVGAGVEVSGSVVAGTESFIVVTNPNAIGSLPEQDIDVDASRVAVGASWTALQHRLLLAAEGVFGATDITDNSAGIKNSLDQTTFRVGAEYFLSEIVAGRAGIALEGRDLSLEDNPDLAGTYNNTALSAGLGIIPNGGIWQFDVTIVTNMSSDLDNKNTVFGTYIKYLF